MVDFQSLCNLVYVFENYMELTIYLLSNMQPSAFVKF